MSKHELFLTLEFNNKREHIRQADIHYIDYTSGYIFMKNGERHKINLENFLDLKDFLQRTINHTAKEVGCNCSVKLGQ